MPRICVSIPAHEQFGGLVDQIENVRAFLPDDTIVVIHLAAGFSDPARAQALFPDGVYVSPLSLNTAWGNVMDQHHANFRFALRRESFDYFVLHASNDMYITPGAENYIAGADAGMQRTPLHPFIEACDASGLEQKREPRDLVCNYRPILEMANELGVDILHTQPEGTFFRTELFEEMIDIISKYWRPGPQSLVGPEHFYYPTIASSLTSSFRLPTVYSDAHDEVIRHPITPSLIRQLRSRRYREDSRDDFASKFGGSRDQYDPFPQYDFDNIYAVKRVPREFEHPNRLFIRALTQLQQDQPFRLRLSSGEKSFVILVDLDEALTNPTIFHSYGEQFDVSDEVEMLIHVPTEDAFRVAELESAVSAAGLDDDKSPGVIVEVLPRDETTRVGLSRSIDVYFSDNTLEENMTDVIRVRPAQASRLQTLVRRHSTG